MTFKEFYDYIQVVGRSVYGFHFVNNYAALHIYDGRRQVNVCINDYDGQGYKPIQDIVFDDDEVKVYNVINGICDYDIARTFHMDDDLEGCLRPLCVEIIKSCLKDDSENLDREQLIKKRMQEIAYETMRL